MDMGYNGMVIQTIFDLAFKEVDIDQDDKIVQDMQHRYYRYVTVYNI